MYITASYEGAYEIVEKYGWEAFLEHLQNEYPELNLYSVTKDWHRLGREYSCKVRGGKGDLIIRWSD